MQGSVNNNQRGIQALCGVIFVMTAQNFFPAIYAIMNHVPKQLPVFYREYGSGMSSPLIFILSDVFSLVSVVSIFKLWKNSRRTTKLYINLDFKFGFKFRLGFYFIC